MPCYSDYVERTPSHEEIQISAMRKRIKQLEACLCGVMTVNPQIVDKIDWREVGVTKEQHMAWWEDHQKKDALRIARQKTREANKLAKAKAAEAAKVAQERREYERLRKKFAGK